MDSVYFLDEDLASNTNQTAGEKFVEHAKELGADTKDVLIHTAANVQHALESAGDFIRTQLATTPSEHPQKESEKDQNNFLQQASALKDVLVQKAIDAKDATVDVLKDLATPLDQSTTTVEFHRGTTTLTTDKKNE